MGFNSGFKGLILYFSRPFFGKTPNIKFYENSVQWEPSCSIRTDRRTDGRRDGHYEATSRNSQFCERALQL